MDTVRDEGAICGRQQNKVFFPRNHTVQVLIVVFVHWKTHTNARGHGWFSTYIHTVYIWLGWCIQDSLEVMAWDSPSQKLTASGNFPARRQTCQRSESNSGDTQHYSRQALDAPLFLFSSLKEPKLIRTGELLFDDRSAASSLETSTIIL